MGDEVKSTTEKVEEKPVKIVSKQKKYGAWYMKPNEWNQLFSEPEKDKDQQTIEQSIAQNNNDPQKLNSRLYRSTLKADKHTNLAALEKIAKKFRSDKLDHTKTDQGIDEVFDLNRELASLHSSKAFLDYLTEKPDLKRPQFMQEIAEIHKEL